MRAVLLDLTKPIPIANILVLTGLVVSRSEAKRKLKQNAVRVMFPKRARPDCNPYRLFHHGQLYADIGMTEYIGPVPVWDDIELRDGDIVRCGYKCVLLAQEGTPTEWQYDIRDQMVAIWGEEKARRQLGEA